MNILHLLVNGCTGGIETLNRDISKYSRNNNTFCFMFGGGEIADEMISSGADVIIIGMRNMRVLYHKINSLVIEKKIGLIVVHHAAPVGWILGGIMAKRHHIKLNIYIHQAMQDALRIGYGKRTRIRRIALKYASKRANNIIAISESVKSSIIEYYPELRDRIIVIYNGVDLNKFCFGTSPNNDVFTILYVGRLYKWKGVDLLIKAVSEMKSRCRCIIVGDGEEKERLIELASELHIADKFEFVGLQKNVAEWYKKTDIFVHPAIWEEGFGITLVEAMASGLPCVAFNKVAVPEIITNNKDGFIVEKVDSLELGKAIDNVIMLSKNKSEEWSSVRVAARHRAESFSIEKMVNKLDKLWGYK